MENEAIELDNLVSKFLMLGDEKSAKDAIAKMQIIAKNEKSIELKSFIEFEVALAESHFHRFDDNKHTENSYHIVKSLVAKLEGLARSKDPNALYYLHEASFQAADFSLQLGKINNAKKLIELSLKAVNYDCEEALIEKAEIFLGNREPQEAKLVLNEIITKYGPKDRSLIKRATINLVLENKTETRDDLKKVSDDISNYPELIIIYLQIPEYEKAKEILKRYITKINKNLDLHINGILLVATNIIHVLTHLLEDNKKEGVENIVKILSLLTNLIDTKDTINIFIPTFQEFGKDKKYGLIDELITLMAPIFGVEKMSSLKPITDSLNFIKTGNTDLLERIHKEDRELVVKIINSIAPEVVIPQLVLDSIEN